MRQLLIKLLLRCLSFLKYQEEGFKVSVSSSVELKKQDNLQDIWFRAVVIVNEINRNYIGYEPTGWKREQLVSKLVIEYPWLEGDELTKIVNGVLG